MTLRNIKSHTPAKPRLVRSLFGQKHKLPSLDGQLSFGTTAIEAVPVKCESGAAIVNDRSLPLCMSRGKVKAVVKKVAWECLLQVPRSCPTRSDPAGMAKAPGDFVVYVLKECSYLKKALSGIGGMKAGWASFLAKQLIAS